jgi:hypothetical protein
MLHGLPLGELSLDGVLARKPINAGLEPTTTVYQTKYGYGVARLRLCALGRKHTDDSAAEILAKVSSVSVCNSEAALTLHQAR